MDAAIEAKIMAQRYDRLTQAMEAAELYNALGEIIANIIPGELLPEYQFKLVRDDNGRWVVREAIDGA